VAASACGRAAEVSDAVPEAGAIYDARPGNLARCSGDTEEAVDAPVAASDCIVTMPADVTPGTPICPMGFDPPSPCTWTGIVAAEATCTTVAPPAFFKGQPPPPPTLKVEIGAVGDCDRFQPYSPGQWVPMVHGGQNGFHVWVGFRVRIDELDDPKPKVQTDVQLYRGCTNHGLSLRPIVYPTRRADGSYVFGSAEFSGVDVRLTQDGAEVKDLWTSDFCNQYYDIHLAVREMKSGRWGESWVRVRTYDTPVKSAP
jgi:hypothetical protein